MSKKVQVSSTDSTEQYLEDKVSAGTGVEITKISDGGVEYLQISSAAATSSPTIINDGYQVGVAADDITPQYLEDKLVAGSNVSLTTVNTGGVKTIRFDVADQIDLSAITFTDGYNLKIDSGDTSPGFLGTKLTAGTGISLTTVDDGGNKTLRIDATESVTPSHVRNDGYEVKSSASDIQPNFLFNKLDAGNNVDLTLVDNGGVQTVRIDVADGAGGAGGVRNDGYEVLSNSSDTTPGFLVSKITAGDNIEITTVDNGGNVTLQISAADQVTAAGLQNDGYELKVSSSDIQPRFLEQKLTAGSNIDIVKVNDGGDEYLQVNAYSNINQDDVEDILSVLDGYQSSGIAGAVQFSDGSNGFNSDENNLFWNNSTKNLGVGTLAPQTNIDVVDSSLAAIRVRNSTSGGTAAIEVGSGGSGTRSSYIDLVGDTTYADYGIRINRTGTTSQILHRGTGDFKIYAFEAADLTFTTSGTERMVITSDGNVGIGVTAPSEKLEVDGSAIITSDITVGGNIVNSDLTETFGAIRTALDGYAADSTVSEHYTQQQEFIHHAREAMDAYGQGITELEHYQQLGDAIQTILKDLDGYAADTTVSEHYTQHSSAIQTILKDLDGYAADSTVSEHYAQQQEFIHHAREAMDAYGQGITELEHYQQLGDAIQTILKDLDGYALATEEDQRWIDSSQQRQDIRDTIDGYALATEEDQRWVDSSQQRQDIRDTIDGYQVQIDGLGQTESEHYQQHSDAIQTILKDLDGYAQTDGEHYRQLGDAIQTILKDLDGYAADSTVSEHYAQHSSAIQAILKDLDGYGQTEQEHHQQVTDAIQTIRKDLDGYAADSTVSEHYTQHSLAIQTILKDLDGYQLQIDGLEQTEGEHYSQHSDAIQTILKDLDGYALATEEDQRWVDSSQQRQDIRDAMDGYGQTEEEHYQQLSDAIQTILKDLDGYAADSTVSEHYAQHSDAIQTILGDLDGYAQTEEEHHQQLSDAIQTIRKDLDGYETKASADSTHTAIGAAIQTIRKDLDGYQVQIDGIEQTESEHHVQHSNAIHTIRKDLDGYNQTIQEHYNQHSTNIQDIRSAADGYSSSFGTGSDGYVAFFLGGNEISGDNDLFWDRNNNRLGLHTTSPGSMIDINGDANISEVLRMSEELTPYTVNQEFTSNPVDQFSSILSIGSFVSHYFNMSHDGSYIISGRRLTGPPHNKVEVSDAYGASWSTVTPPVMDGNTNDTVVGVYTNSDGSVLFVADQGGGVSDYKLYRSGDGGSNWTDVTPSAGASVISSAEGLTMDPDGNKVFSLFSTAIANGSVKYSSNSGSSWVDRTPSAVTYQFRSISGQSASDTSFKAVLAEYDGRIYTTTDAGSTWTARTLDGYTTSGWSRTAINGDGSVMMAGSNDIPGTVMLSKDGGATWEQKILGLGNQRADRLSMSTDGEKLLVYFATSGGGSAASEIYFSSDGGDNWVMLSVAGDSLNNPAVISTAGDVILAHNITQQALYIEKNFLNFTVDGFTINAHDYNPAPELSTTLSNIVSRANKFTDKTATVVSGATTISYIADGYGIATNGTVSFSENVDDGNLYRFNEVEGTNAQIYSNNSYLGIGRAVIATPGYNDDNDVVMGNDLEVKGNILIGGSLNNDDLSETIGSIRTALDGYTGSAEVDSLRTTVDEHYSQHSQAITTIRDDLDGYSTLSLASASDGYIAFFTGSDGIAGDNDLYFNRVENKLEVTNLKVTNGATDGSVLTSDSSGNATWQSSSANDFDLIVVDSDTGEIVIEESNWNVVSNT